MEYRKKKNFSYISSTAGDQQLYNKFLSVHRFIIVTRSPIIIVGLFFFSAAARRAMGFVVVSVGLVFLPLADRVYVIYKNHQGVRKIMTLVIFHGRDDKKKFLLSHATSHIIYLSSPFSFLLAYIYIYS